MTVRFFILQAHYRSTLDFSNEALQAAEKGYKKLMQAAKDVKNLKSDDSVAVNGEIAALKGKIYDALCDDMNTPVALSYIFEAVKLVNISKDKSIKLNSSDKQVLTLILDDIVTGVLGLVDESENGGNMQIIDGLINMLLEDRKTARAEKNWAKCDAIRDSLKALGISIKDTKDGCEWSIE
jgi:cysteinyl-tRNA synthetase